MSRSYLLKNSQFSVGYDLPKEINEARKDCGRKQNALSQNSLDPSVKLYILPSSLLMETL